MAKRTCSIDGCEKFAHGRGLCTTHYQRLTRTGSAILSVKTEAERFWAKVTIAGPDECWLWTAATYRNGYGAFGVSGRARRMTGAHRFAYELTHGPIPDDLLVCHTCDVRACVNPAHLFLGTHRDNLTDMATKGRSTRGVKNTQAKLTEAEVLAIRADGRFGREVAADYGVSEGTIYNIWHRRTWGWLS